MKKLLITGLFMIFPIMLSYAQDFPLEFGNISREEIELDHYSKDKDAEALVLFNIGKTHFVRNNGSFDVMYERSTRIKIFTDAGTKWSEVEIPFYNHGSINETVTEIEAYAYNAEEGEIIKTPLNSADIYEERINEYWNMKKFAIPNVKEGTIIEYSYKIRSQHLFNLRDWEFQWRIPVLHSEFELRMIPFYEYSWLIQGIDELDIYEIYRDGSSPRYYGSGGAYTTRSYHDRVFRFGLRDIPAFIEDEFITSVNDYIIKIDFQLARITSFDGSSRNIMTSWMELKNSLSDHSGFGIYANRSRRRSSRVIDVREISDKPDRKAFNHVMDFVKENYRWNDRNGIFAGKRAREFINEKSGNSAEINLFTIGMLNSVGVEAYPVLSSTRRHGRIRYDFPNLNYFNYVLIAAIIDGEMVLTDATDPKLKNDRIPAKCINEKGLIINDRDDEEWVSLEPDFPSKIKREISIRFNENNEIAADITKTATEYDALFYRDSYTDDKETVFEKLDSKEYRIKEESISVQNQDKIELPYILDYKISDASQTIGESIYLSPFLNEVITENPFSQEERTYPVNMNYPGKRVYKTTINIPEGYEPEYLPDRQRINNQLFELNYSAESDNGIITVSFDYHFKQSVYSPSDYSNVRFYYDQIVNRGSEMIILSKISDSDN